MRCRTCTSAKSELKAHLFNDRDTFAADHLRAFDASARSENVLAGHLVKKCVSGTDDRAAGFKIERPNQIQEFAPRDQFVEPLGEALSAGLSGFSPSLKSTSVNEC